MPIADWLHKYPGVQRLLQQDAEALEYAPDGENIPVPLGGVRCWPFATIQDALYYDPLFMQGLGQEQVPPPASSAVDMAAPGREVFARQQAMLNNALNSVQHEMLSRAMPDFVRIPSSYHGPFHHPLVLPVIAWVTETEDIRFEVCTTEAPACVCACGKYTLEWEIPR